MKNAALFDDLGRRYSKIDQFRSRTRKSMRGSRFGRASGAKMTPRGAPALVFVTWALVAAPRVLAAPFSLFPGEPPAAASPGAAGFSLRASLLPMNPIDFRAAAAAFIAQELLAPTPPPTRKTEALLVTTGVLLGATAQTLYGGIGRGYVPFHFARRTGSARTPTPAAPTRRPTSSCTTDCRGSSTSPTPAWTIPTIRPTGWRSRPRWRRA
jgi:hypothetical protein